MDWNQPIWKSSGAAALFLVGVTFLGWLYSWLAARIESWASRQTSSATPSLAHRLLPSERLAFRLVFLLNLIRWSLVALAFVRLVSFILQLFEETESFGQRMVELTLLPFQQFFQSILDYIPNLFQIFAILTVTYYVLQLIHRAFEEVASGRLSIRNFHPEWAEPTYKLIRAFVLILAAVGVFPYLPGSHSPAFQTITVFLGVLLSLGSSSVMSNLVSGIVLIYMRALSPGDRVKIGDTFGDVVERTMLCTKVRNLSNELVTIPNSVVLSAHIINYSALASSTGLVLKTTLTIGYDAPWPRVHSAMLAAAARTEGLLEDPKPFVLQTALNDYNVSYELNTTTRLANRTQLIYSDLRRHLQDTFDEAQIEILSPMYNTVRSSTPNDTLERRG